jgi:hypothetical protein
MENCNPLRTGKNRGLVYYQGRRRQGDQARSRSDLGWHVLGRWHKALADNAFQRAMALVATANSCRTLRTKKRFRVEKAIEQS